MGVRSHWWHTSTLLTLVTRVDVGHVRTKLSKRGRPLDFLLLFLRTIVAEHVRELGSFVWNSALKTVTRPYLELFIFTE